MKSSSTKSGLICVNLRNLRTGRFLNSAIRNPQSAITLLEMLAAMVITTMILVSLGGALSVTLRGIEKMRGVMRQTRKEAGLARVIDDDMRYAFRAGEKGSVFFGGQPDEGASFLKFTSTHFLAGDDAPPPTGLVRAEYSLAPSKQTTGAYQIMRRESPYVPGSITNQPAIQAEPLADNVTSVEMRFFDGRRWEDHWSRDSLPELIRMRLTFYAPEGEKAESAEYSFAPGVDTGAMALP